jgi:hypothetical protein
MLRMGGAMSSVVVASCLAPTATGNNCHGPMHEGLHVLAVRHLVSRVIALLSFAHKGVYI